MLTVAMYCRDDRIVTFPQVAHYRLYDDSIPSPLSVECAALLRNQYLPTFHIAVGLITGILETRTFSAHSETLLKANFAQIISILTIGIFSTHLICFLDSQCVVRSLIKSQ